MNKLEVERRVLVTIRSGSKKEKHENWQWWEIIDSLRCKGVSLMESQDAAKWALKATPGMKLNVSKDITLEATKDITQEEAVKWLNT